MAPVRSSPFDAPQSPFDGWRRVVSSDGPADPGDLTAPVLSAPLDAADGHDAATVSVDTDTGEGVLHIVLTGSATTPSAAQVKLGQDHAGSAAAWADSQAVSTTGTQNAAPDGLSAETSYYAHFMHEDVALNQSNVASGDGFTTGAAPAFAVANQTPSFGQQTLEGAGAHTFAASSGTILSLGTLAGTDAAHWDVALNAGTVSLTPSAAGETAGLASGPYSLTLPCYSGAGQTGSQDDVTITVTTSGSDLENTAHVVNDTEWDAFKAAAPSGTVAKYRDGSAMGFSQHGIRWLIDEDRTYGSTYGRFISLDGGTTPGDFWAQGGFDVTEINPAWDGTARHGAMLDWTDEASQGFYDRSAIDGYSITYGFSAGARDAPPIEMEATAKHSLIMTIGLTTPKVGGAAEMLDVAVVFTSVTAAQAASMTSTMFRPTWHAGATIKFLDYNDVDLAPLPDLALPGGTTLPLHTRITGMPWLHNLHSTASTDGAVSVAATVHPFTNFDDKVYPRDSANEISLMACAACVQDADNPNRASYIKKLVQIGIDLFACHEAGNQIMFLGTGGFGNGWLFPIVFTGVLFDDTDMKGFDQMVTDRWGSAVQRFGEQTMTFMGTNALDTDLPRAMWGADGIAQGYGAGLYSNHDKRDPNTPKIGEVEPVDGYPAIVGAATGNYRTCCTSWSWIGQAIALQNITGAVTVWNHAPFFRYVERWVRDGDRGNGIFSTFHGDANGFLQAMWSAYYPLEAPALTSLASAGASGGSASFDTTHGDGWAFCVFSTGSTTPSEDQILQGLDAADAAAASFVKQTITGTGTQTLNASGLTNGVTYYPHVMQVRGTSGLYTTPDTGPSFVAVVGDVTAPTLSSPVDAADGATAATGSVSTDEGNGTLYWVCSTSGTAPSAAQVKAGNDHTGSAAADSGSQSVSGTGTQNLSPAPSGLTASTGYWLHFMHEDASANQSTVASGDGFTTEAADVTAPTISSTSPADNATGVAITVNPTITFDEDVAFGTGNITLRSNDGGWADVEVFDVTTDTGGGAGTVSISGAVLTIEPTADLDNEIEYAIRIAATAIDDLSGNSFAGITDDTTISFTTAAAASGIVFEGETEGTTTGTTSHVITLPAGIVAGEMIVAVLTRHVGTNGSSGAPPTMTWPGSWATIMADQRAWVATQETGSLSTTTFGYLIASGGETSVTVTSVDAGSEILNSAWRAFRISGNHASAAPEGASVGGTLQSANPDPPNLAPSWGSAATGWLALEFHRNETGSAVEVTGYPSGYSGGDYVQGGNNGMVAASASKVATAASDNPGTYTLGASRRYTAATIAIRPA